MRQALIIVAATLALNSGALAEVMLRASTTVDAPVVTLADVFEGAQAYADVVLIAAPAPGQRLILDAGQVGAVARTQGLQWHATPGFARIVVVRASRLVPRDDIEDALARTIRDGGFAEDVEIELFNRGFQMHVAPDAAPGVGVRDISIDRSTGLFTATLSAPPNAHESPAVRVSGRAFELVEVPVLRRSVAVGEAVRAEDVSWQPIRRDRIRGNMVTDTDEVVGLEPRRRIRAGEPIRASDLRPVETISKGTVVTMVVRAPGITLTATGRAIQAGATGDIIRVSNLKSHRIVQGTIVSPGRVDVQGAPRFIGGQDGKTP